MRCQLRSVADKPHGMSSTPLPPALRVLVRERNVAADAALAEVLPLLEERVRREVWDLLVRRGHEPTLAAIVAKFGSYTPALQIPYLRLCAS